MIIGGRRASFLLFVGDIAAFALSLYLTLWLRYGVAPSALTLEPYLAPFAFLFIIWALVFYGSGLYSKRLALFPSRQPDALLKTQIANIIFAAIFFFLIPAFGIAPKTILALYLVVSLILISLWRLALYPRFTRPGRRDRVLLIAEGEEAQELRAEVNGNPRYGIEFVGAPSLEDLATPEALSRLIRREHAVALIVENGYASEKNILPSIYHVARIERQCQFATFEDMYEEVFDRIPLSRLEHAWFLENVASTDPLLYRVAKRLFDIAGGLCMGLITIVAVPFVFVANLFEGMGPLFIAQERFGRYGALVTSYKFRSMRFNKAASGEWTIEEKHDNPVTKVGNFLRRTSLDEFPQFMNVLRGEISLIGPRNDILGLGKRLAEALPYYEARYLVKPGITGWAQINQQYEPGNVSPQSIKETKVRLAYDFYYLKHRSLGLDIMIALKTFKRMFFRVSSW